MAKQTSKTLIGGFVVGAVALIVAGVLIFGSGKFFQESSKYVLFFRDLDSRRGFPLKTVRICDRKNMTPVINFEPAPWGAPQTHDGLVAISSGRYDQYFRRWGHDAARWGKTVIFRFV